MHSYLTVILLIFLNNTVLNDDATRWRLIVYHDSTPISAPHLNFLQKQDNSWHFNKIYKQDKDNI